MQAIFTRIIFMKLLCKKLLIRHELHVLISSTEQTLPKVHLSHNIKLHTLQLPFIGENLLALILLNSPLFDHCYLSWTWTLGFIMNLAEIIHHEPVQLFIMSLTAVTKMCSLKKPEHNDSPWTHDNL